MPHALKGTDFIKNHAESRAEDLLRAFQDDSMDIILCAIGGEDTYRLLPFLFQENELEKAVKQKIFLGFSDTTMNHLMLHKVGIKTFYGQAFLPDICELSAEMLPYTKSYFEELITTGKISETRPSDVWYKERKEATIQSLKGAMREGDYGLFVTLSNDTKNAQKYLDSTPVIRGINGTDLVDLILKYYHDLSDKYKKMIPLKMVYIPVAKGEQE